MSIEKLSNLGDYIVYKDNVENNNLRTGYKGRILKPGETITIPEENIELTGDSGYVYAPYIPILDNEI